MEKIVINKLGPIKHCELNIDDFMVFTGPQASGKSTIAKSIFFFKNIKNLLLLQINKRFFDSRKKAYLIELKGGNIDDAVEQLEAGEQKCKDELKEYIFFYRIICSKARTHNLRNVKFRKFKEKCGPRLLIKENILSETLD